MESQDLFNDVIPVWLHYDDEPDTSTYINAASCDPISPRRVWD